MATKYSGHLDGAEWNFRSLAGKKGASQRRFCFYWEYWRESPILRDVHAQFKPTSWNNEGDVAALFFQLVDRVSFLPRDVNSGATSVQDAVQQKYIPLYAYEILTHPSFPETPWLKVDEKFRKDLQQKVAEAVSTTIKFDFGLMIRLYWG